MLFVENLSIETLKGRKLIENLSFYLNNGDKLAIIGEEGNGKSTLMKAIVNEKLITDYCHVSGKIFRDGCTIGYLEQKLNLRWADFCVLDYFLKDDIDSEINYERYNKINQITRILKDLNFNSDYLNSNMQIKNLSGGEQVKLQIAKLILTEPDVICLDEPTNDLDIETLKILENYIKNSNKPVVFISHDEVLLENTANRILHIEQLIRKSKPKFTLERCGYAEYVDARIRSIEHQTQVASFERREKYKKERKLMEIKQKVENALVAAKKDPSSGRIIAKKMANVKALERRYENEDTTEMPDVEEAIKIIVDEKITIPNQKKVLDVSIDNLSIGEKTLSKNIKLNIFGPQKVAIIGKNGCGKTTLLKKLIPILRETSGVKVGYFSQNYQEILNFEHTPVEELQNSNRDFNAMTLLGSLKFTHEEMTHKIKDLSEGQKAKVALMKLIVEKNNVLVLDEPTRNLSPLSNPVIRKMLNKYNGCILTVSHDRKFIYEVCDIVYRMDENGLKKLAFEKNEF